MTLSLNTRLLLASSVVLAAFLGITGLVLDSAFRASADTALRDRLQGYVYALLAASDLDARGRLRLPAELPDPRFSLIGSGLYAEVVDSGGRPVWRLRLDLHIVEANLTVICTEDDGVHREFGKHRAGRLGFPHDAAWTAVCLAVLDNMQP